MLVFLQCYSILRSSALFPFLSFNLFVCCLLFFHKPFLVFSNATFPRFVWQVFIVPFRDIYQWNYPHFITNLLGVIFPELAAQLLDLLHTTDSLGVPAYYSNCCSHRSPIEVIFVADGRPSSHRRCLVPSLHAATGRPLHQIIGYREVRFDRC